MSRPREKAPIAVGRAYLNKQATRNRIITGFSVSDEPDGTPDYASNRTVIYRERSVKEPEYGTQEKSCSMRSFYVWAATVVPNLPINATTAAA